MMNWTRKKAWKNKANFRAWGRIVEAQGGRWGVVFAFLRILAFSAKGTPQAARRGVECRPMSDELIG
jgi:hypothetical protein